MAAHESLEVLAPIPRIPHEDPDTLPRYARCKCCRIKCLGSLFTFTLPRGYPFVRGLEPLDTLYDETKRGIVQTSAVIFGLERSSPPLLRLPKFKCVYECRGAFSFHSVQ